MLLEIDSWYAEGCTALPPEQQRLARELPFHLGLAPRPDIPWSETFQHAVTLAAPACFADALPQASAGDVRHATISHMFAVIEAFTSDRIHDGQVTARAAALSELAASFRTLRSRHAQDLDPDAIAAFTLADREVQHAHEREREILAGRRAAPLYRYETVSLQKQAIGFPATLALARSAGLTANQRRLLREALEGVWLGLQFADDVIDWEDDFARGGAWAVCVARGLGASVERAADFATVREAVFGSRALARMLTMARERFERAQLCCTELGADQLTHWARAQRDRIAELEAGEEEAPGYAIRAHKLRHFAREVPS